MVKKLLENLSKQRRTYKKGYQVEAIRSSRINQKGEKQYEVKWVNYGQRQNTWEPVQHLINVINMVNKFQNKQNKLKHQFTTKVINQIVSQKKQEPLKAKIKKSHKTAPQIPVKAQKLRQKTIFDFFNKKKTTQSFKKQISSLTQHSAILKKTSIQQQDIQQSSLSLVSSSIQIKSTAIKNQQTINQKFETDKSQQAQIQPVITSFELLSSSQTVQNKEMERDKIFKDKKQQGYIQSSIQGFQQKIISQIPRNNKKKPQLNKFQQQFSQSKRLQALNEKRLKKLEKQSTIETPKVQQIYYNIEQTLLKMKGMSNARTEFHDKIMYCIQCENAEYKMITKQEILKINPQWLQIFLQLYI